MTQSPERSSATPVWRDQMGESGGRHIEVLFGLFDLGADVGRFIPKTRDLFDHMRNVVWLNLLSLPSGAQASANDRAMRRKEMDHQLMKHHLLHRLTNCP